MSSRRDILIKETIDKTVEYIKENYQRTDISLKQVSKEASSSYYYFSHIFREYCKMGFIEYLTKIRLREAAKLLKNPRLNVDQIAFAVGYHDRGYFTKVFRKVYKIPPTEYREEFFKRRK